MSIESQAREHRRELIRRERAAQRAMLQAYGLTIRRIRAQLDAVGPLIRRAAQEGDAAMFIARQDRLQRMLDDLHAELRAFGRVAAQRITALQSDQAQAGLQDAYDLTRTAVGEATVSLEFRPPDHRIVLTLAGSAVDGTPLGMLLDEAAGSAAQAARQELIAGAVQGLSPRETARNIVKVSSIPRDRALLIARTEGLRAYRTASLETYRANPQTVKGWVWLSALDKRTCPVCWAMHGTNHRLDETLDTHPGCRCTAAPRTFTWEELGLPGVPGAAPTIRPGVDVFDELDAATQRQILGPGRHELYRRGDITLRDVVARTRSERWGRGRRARALHELRT